MAHGDAWGAVDVVSGAMGIGGVANGARLASRALSPTKLGGGGLPANPTYDELIDLVQNSLDFSTKRNAALFWSGGNMKLAQRIGRLTGKTTLEQTRGGRYLDALKLFERADLTGKQAANIWNLASLRFAKGATGRINVFAFGAKKYGPYGMRTWWRIERRALLDQGKRFRVWRWRGDRIQDGL
jgi:hypothetical protein